MKIFLSSTFIDLAADRQAVLEALQRRRASTLAMEYFLATSTTPAETALENLRNSDVTILVIGFKAGSLLSDGTGKTYTRAEYEELLKLEKEALVFVKQKRGWFKGKPSWKNEEKNSQKRKALEDFKARVGQRGHHTKRQKSYAKDFCLPIEGEDQRPHRVEGILEERSRGLSCVADWRSCGNVSPMAFSVQYVFATQFAGLYP